MKKKLLLLGALVLMFSTGLVHTQPAARVRLAILPFATLGVDEASTLTAQSLLRQELEKLNKIEVIAEKQTAEAVGPQSCYEKECAIEVGRALAADQVLLCSLNRLGEKVIIQYFIVAAKSGSYLLNDNTTSTTIEDLEVVMKRVALCVTTLKPFNETAQVDLITQKEALEPQRKSARKYMGLSFGYLYPQQGYDEKDRHFAMDLRTGYEIKQFAVGSQLAIQHGFAWNIFCSYLFTRTDVCPYLGGAAGFHWVSHETHGEMVVRPDKSYYYQEDNRKGDGFELRLHSGMRFFRTFNFQILLNLEYALTLNDFDDRAVILTIGLLR